MKQPGERCGSEGICAVAGCGHQPYSRWARFAIHLFVAIIIRFQLKFQLVGASLLVLELLFVAFVCSLNSFCFVNWAMEERLRRGRARSAPLPARDEPQPAALPAQAEREPKAEARPGSDSSQTAKQTRQTESEKRRTRKHVAPSIPRTRSIATRTPPRPFALPATRCSLALSGLYILLLFVARMAVQVILTLRSH